MILGIICSIIFILSLLVFTYYSDEINYFGMILTTILAFVSGMGIITFIFVNADKIISWFVL